MTGAPRPQGFNWDSDYDDLVAERKLRVLPPDGAPDPGTEAPLRTGLSWMSRALIPAVICAGLVGAYAVLGSSAFGSKVPVQTASFLSLAMPQFATAPLPALQAYTDQQSLHFLHGLNRFSDADLLRYAETTRRDLARAGTMLAPFMRDALALAEFELTRRAVTIGPAVGQLQDVRIEHKLRG